MLPAKTDERWKKMIDGQYNSTLKSLGAKILIGRLFLTYKREPQQLDKCIDELYQYFTNNAQSAADDIKTIFG